MSDQNEPKKETVRITLPPRAPAKPPEEEGGSRDTVRINLPARASATPEAPKPVKPPIPTTPPRPGSAPPMARPPIPTASGAPPPRPPSFSPPAPPAGGAAAPRRPMAPPMIPKPSAAGTPPPAPPKGAPAMPPRPSVLPPPPRVIPPAAAPGVATGSVSSAPANYPGSATQSGPKKETARISILPEPAAPPNPTVRMTKTQPLLQTPTPKVHSAPPVKVAAATATVSSDDSLMDRLDAVPMPICWTIFAISTVTLLIQIWNYLSS